ncbi:MAG: hypothetical protein LLF94_07970 [Chlamydiales bacterium]|nr:hypothetical protein [Chlamydiales bacterium]
MSITSVSQQALEACRKFAAATVTTATSAGSKVLSLGNRVVSFVTPHLSAIVQKVKSVTPPAFLAKAWTAVNNKTGAGVGLLGLSISCLVLAKRSEKTVSQVVLGAAGVSALALATLVITRPFGARI